MTTDTTTHPLTRALLFVALTALVIYGLSRLRYNLRTPLVIGVQANGCYLSPGGTYMYVAESDFVGDEGLPVYSTSDGKRSQIHLPESYKGGEAVWLDDGVLFDSYMWGREYPSHKYALPDNGWVINVSTQTLTDTRILPVAERQEIFERARALVNRKREKYNTFPYMSPDGRYGYEYGTIIDIQSHTILNTVEMADESTCEAGWRPDSSGYYFIDRPEMTFVRKPGPIRLLLTHPPVP